MLDDNRNLRAKIDELETGRTEFFRVDIGDGIALDAWCMLPPDFDREREIPACSCTSTASPRVRRCSTAGGVATTSGTGCSPRTATIVMSFDNRGTPAPRGRAWRKAVFRQVGILAPKDQAAAVKAVLRKRPYHRRGAHRRLGLERRRIDDLECHLQVPRPLQDGHRRRAGRQSAVLRHDLSGALHGPAGRQRRGFHQGSPINFAHQLKGNLLLIHGTGDDNCHYQGTEALINELIRHNKPFTMMAYPNRSHGITRARTRRFTFAS